MVISPSFSEGTNSAEWLEQITRFVTNSRAVCRSHRSPPHRLGWRRPALPHRSSLPLSVKFLNARARVPMGSPARAGVRELSGGAGGGGRGSLSGAAGRLMSGSTARAIQRSRSAASAAASATRTAAGSAPTAAATWRATVAQRGGRRLLATVTGHSVQARTIRSSGDARSSAATLFACARLR